MKNKLINISKEKGFKSKIVEPKDYELWLFELRGWLKREAGLYASANPVNHLKEWQAAVEYDDLINFKSVYDSITDAGSEKERLFKEEHQALEIALYEALKLTKK